MSVCNEGSFAGNHVVQVYSESSTNDKSLFRPARELIAFEKVWLEPGETKRVSLTATCRDITGVWDEVSNIWIARGGDYAFTVEDCRISKSLDGGHRWLAC